MNKRDNSYLFQPEFVIPDHINTILCFGDSNTWGWDPNGGGQLDHPWPILLQQILEPYQWIIDGQCGRSINHNQSEKGIHSGEVDFQKYQPNHQLLLLMLGTNDLCRDFALSPGQIAENLAKLCSRWPHHQKVIMAPPPITLLSPDWRPLFAGREDDSLQLAECYQELATELECGFFNVGDIALPGKDGVHLCAEGHQLVALALAKYLKCEPPHRCPGIDVAD